MTRRAAIRVSNLIWLVCLSSLPAVGESNYCAFQIRVSSPAGNPLAEIPVVLGKQNKTTYSETATDSVGIARICDAPMEPVDLVVGLDLCGSVVVRSVKARWPKTQEVFVTYVKTYCDHMAVSQSSQVLLRVQDEMGLPVVGARFEGVLAGDSGSAMSDSLGRIFRVVKRNQRLEGRVTKAGRSSGPISLSVEDDVELKVVLKR